MQLGLDGKRALVTGSTSGIGLGIAECLAEEGCDLVLNSRSAGRDGERIAADLAAKTARQVIYRAADMSQSAAIRELCDGLLTEFGGIDILVNNAGVQVVSPLTEFAEADWNRVQATNLDAAFHTTKALLPGMYERQWGRVVNIASAHGLVASPFKSAYVAAKHGLVGLGKVVGLEGAERGVTCNTVCPGYVWTPLVERQIEDQARAHGIDRERVVHDILLAPQPTRRFVQVREVAALTAFLCSDLAASITGAAIPVDGGWTAR